MNTNLSENDVLELVCRPSGADLVGREGVA
jgi:hypothetical protein